MTTWAELRTVALVGTERRTLAGHGAADADRAALQAAAILGAAQRAGFPIAESDSPTDPATDQPNLASDAADPGRAAPDEAVQLIELLLGGNTGPAAMSTALVERWLERCHATGHTVPHRLLVALLDAATVTSSLRDRASAVIGVRGRWLASQRPKWEWARASPHEDQAPEAFELDIDTVLEFPADARDQMLVAARDADPAAGRRLIAEACERLDASSRARVLGCLRSQLSLDDEDLLEAGLDDRSIAVRTEAIDLLIALPGSSRGERLTRVLEPLVSLSGKLRTTIHVDYPDVPESEQLRDLPPNGNGVIEQQWFDAIITGTPLRWWEETLDLSPAKIVRSKLKPADELTGAWCAAAIAQRDEAWIEPLFELTRNPALLAFIGNGAAARAFLDAITKPPNQKDDPLHRQLALLTAVPEPWDLDFSRSVIGWARNSNGGTGAHQRMNQAQTTLAERLHPDAQPDLMRWLDAVRGEDHKNLQRSLRTVIQHVSMRTSIHEAFS